MDNSSDNQILGLTVDDVHGNQNITFEDGPSLGTKRLHLDSESSVDVEVNSLSGYIMGKRIKLENASEEDDTNPGLMQGTSCDELSDEHGIMLGSTASEGISSTVGDMVFSNEDDNIDDDSCMLIHHMDIKEPLTNLKKALEENHNMSLEGYEFYLQNTTLLAGHKNLVEQCVQGCGTVQVNLQLKIEDDGTKKINIIDVLKPSDSYLMETGSPAFSPDLPEEASQPAPLEEDGEQDPRAESEKNLIRWIVDPVFKANQHKLQIPSDPLEWDVAHVRHWLLWAVRQFNLSGIQLSDWKIPGVMLCNLTLEDFKVRVPYDPGDIFWTHLELLRRCKFVAVMQSPEGEEQQENLKDIFKGNLLDKNIMRGKDKKVKTSMMKSAVITDSDAQSAQTTWDRSRCGNNGQVQLWQFLLDLLTDKRHRDCIQWHGPEGEFKLVEPERVAQLWGMRKNKPSMNYEKLSRALRYYYDGDMIAKVHGKRFVYKFVCDLKQLLGYSSLRLNALVTQAEMKASNTNNNDILQHSIFGNRDYM